MLGTVQDLECFMSSLNINNVNIKLSFKHGRKNIDFLDALSSTDDNGYFSSDLYRKTTDTNTLLHAKSSYPKTIDTQHTCQSISKTEENLFERRILRKLGW